MPYKQKNNIYYLIIVFGVITLLAMADAIAHSYTFKKSDNKKAVWTLADPKVLAMGGKVQTDNTALLIIDFQNFCASKKGILGKTTSQWEYISKHKTIDNTKLAITKARKAGIPIIYIKARLDTRIMPHWEVFKEIKQKIDWTELSAKQQSWDYQVVDGIRPHKYDYVVWKGNWTNGYRDTDLRTILHALKIRRLVIAGVAESACVYGTFLGTFDEGIEPIMLSDCLVPAGSDEQMENKVHDFSIKIFYPMMGARVITSKELIFVK